MNVNSSPTHRHHTPSLPAADACPACHSAAAYALAGRWTLCVCGRWRKGGRVALSAEEEREVQLAAWEWEGGRPAG